ncbi:hypothetical protein IC582_001884 [Cucumis melo]
MDCCSDDHLSVGADEDVAQVDCFLETSSQRSMRGPTTMIHLTQISSDANRLVVDYNERGEWIGENATQIVSYIGTCVRNNIPITYASWLDVPLELKDKIYVCIQKSFVTNPKSKKDILKKLGSAFRNFKNILRNNYIFPYIDELECLKFPPPNYPAIDLSDWETFVSLSMSEDFLKRSNMQKERRNNYRYNHRTSRKGYTNLEEELDKLQKDVDKTYNVSYDILTQALGTPEHRGHVRGVGGLITPSFYFHKHIPSEPRETHITVDVDANWKKEKSQILSEYSQMAKQMLKLKSLKRNRETSLDAHSGCNQNISEKQFISTSIHHTEKIDLGRPCSLAIGKVDNIVATGTVFERISTDEIVYGTSSKKSRELEALKGTKSKMNELKLPMTIRFVLRHVEKDMKDEYFTIPVGTQEIFGYNFNVNVMKDSIKRLCLMEELAFSVILSYMICLYESDPNILEEYAFMNPGQISKGLGTNENRARHLCNRLVSIKNKLLICPFNCGGLRMFYVETNTRARPHTWVSVKCAQQPGSTECGYYVMKFMKDIVRQKSITITDVLTRQAPYTQSELDMVRVEYCDFLGRYI